MRNRNVAVLERPVEKAHCKHHWLIEPANGPTSKGVCKFCGEEKFFDNVLEDLLAAVDSFTPFDPGSLEDKEDEGSVNEAE